MYACWNAVFLVLATMTTGDRNPQHGDCWTLDKTVVTQGGCVTVVVDRPCSERRDLALQIDNRKVVGLLEGVGPDYHDRSSRLSGRHATLVLVFRDLVNPEGLGEDPGEPGTFRFVPVFNEPGLVDMTLYAGDEPLGTQTVTVVACEPGACDALRLLYPPIGREKRASREDLLWSELIQRRTFGVNPRITEEQLQLLHAQLPTIKQHPDWAEIAELLVGRLEASVHYRELTVSPEGRLPRIKSGVSELTPMPDIVKRCIERQPMSPYAQAIQDDIRSVTAQLRRPEIERQSTARP